MGLEEVHVPDFVPDEDRRYYEKSGFGERMGWGTRPALLVVDMTRRFTMGEHALGRTDTGTEAVEAVGDLLTVARDRALPVVFTRGASGPDARDRTGVWLKKISVADDREDGDEIDSRIAPRDGEIVIEKSAASAFFDTRLSSLLRFRGVDTVIVTGMVTSGCVRATVVDACSYNYHTIVPRECVADRAEVSHEIALFEMDLKYADVVPLGEVVARLGSLTG